MQKERLAEWFTIRSLAWLILPAVGLASDNIHAQRAAAFCKWSQQQPPDEHGAKYCADYPALPPERQYEDLEDVFRLWARIDGDGSRYKAFSAFWAVTTQKLEADLARRRADAKRAAFIANISTSSIEALCAELRRKAPASEALSEIRRRQSFPAGDIPMITRHVVQLGMREESMVCSLGPPRSVNRTVGSLGVHKQYVYPRGYVYTENGVVTSFQD
jgi:hypothetical protein